MIAQGSLGGVRVAFPRVRMLRRTRLGSRWRLRIVALAVIAALLVGAWLWFRDSSLVAVRRVTVTGAEGPDGAAIRAALISAAHNMTTLHVHVDRLRTAVAPYPVVDHIAVSTHFPHGLRIRVVERIPVGTIQVGGRTIAVAGDGTVLRDVPGSASLPVIAMRVPPGGRRVSDPEGRSEVALLAAAPYRLLSIVSQVTTMATHGLVAQIRGGPNIYFGAADRLAAKWIAASEVLGDSGSGGAGYIDVTDAQRPAAGAGSDQATTGASSGQATTGASSGQATTGASSGQATTGNGQTSTGSGRAATAAGSGPTTPGKG
jgi:cell division protein FtsQ